MTDKSNKTNEARIAALEAEIAALRRPVPREEPQLRKIAGTVWFV